MSETLAHPSDKKMRLLSAAIPYAEDPRVSSPHQQCIHYLFDALIEDLRPLKSVGIQHQCGLRRMMPLCMMV